MRQGKRGCENVIPSTEGVKLFTKRVLEVWKGDGRRRRARRRNPNARNMNFAELIVKPRRSLPDPRCSRLGLCLSC